MQINQCLAFVTIHSFFIFFKGLVAYASLRYDVALGHFSKAVQTNPVASGASVRLAVALCCYKLELYDRARAAIEKCIQLDVST